MKYITSFSCLFVGIMAFGFSGMANAETTSKHSVLSNSVKHKVKQKQTISFGTAPTITAGTAGTISVSASSGLPVTLVSKTPAVCSVSGNTVTGLNAGICTIAADQAGNSNYAPATEVTQIFKVNQQVATNNDNGDNGDNGGNGGNGGSGGNGSGSATKLPVTAPFNCNTLASSGNAAEDGRRAYVRLNCASCHGQDGSGSMGPDIRGSGGDVAEAVNGGEGAMPSFAGFLCANDVTDLEAYLNSINKIAKHLDWDVQLEKITDGTAAPAPNGVVVGP